MAAETGSVRDPTGGKDGTAVAKQPAVGTPIHAQEHGLRAGTLMGGNTDFGKEAGGKTVRVVSQGR
jgi:hypothetical protein